MTMSRGKIKLSMLCAIGLVMLLITSPVWASPARMTV